VQVTPPGSRCSIIFGKGITSTVPGSMESLMLVVDDIEMARAEFGDRGVAVGEVFHDAGGVFHHAGVVGRVAGPDPTHRSYGSFASFADPDSNGRLLQEIRDRLPGRWSDLVGSPKAVRDREATHLAPANTKRTDPDKTTRLRKREPMDVATLADLLRETAEHHGHFEKIAPPHNWWDWYAPYMAARQQGSTPEEASRAAGLYMKEVRHVVPPWGRDA
jgi:hypothetical protein